MDDIDDLREEEENNLLIAALAAVWVVNSAVAAASIYAEPLFNKTPYHTSALTGEAWVLELLTGHPERIRNELGVHKEVFNDLLQNLCDGGCGPSKHVSLEEKLAIFLYTCVTGLSLRHVGERFQRSTETISKYVFFSIYLNEITNISRYFREMLVFFSSPPFYSNNVHLPTANTPPSLIIEKNPKFFPFFRDAIGAIDGTHINAHVTVEERQASRDRKGGVTQNCLAACDFEMRFVYIFSGWDGSAADSTMFHDARLTDLPIPHGKYFLADAGFQTCDALLIPYRGVRYHLAEWGRADLR
jgi:DDE superfamily endonuclease